LYDTFKSKGLSIVGVTDEGKSKTEPWIEEHKAAYPYGYDKNGKLKRALKLTGYPTAWLVDATGTVVWKGHPGNLRASEIEKHLDGALSRPMWEWPDSFSPVAKALKKKQYAKALEAAEKVSQSEQDGPKILAAVRGMIAGRLSAVKKAYDDGDFLTAVELAKSAKKSLAGLPEGDEVAVIAKKISKDRDAGSVMKAQKMVRKLTDEPVRSAKDAEELIAQLERISKKNPGTAAAREADEFVASLQKRLGR
jgi:hypothetical protein